LCLVEDAAPIAEIAVTDAEANRRVEGGRAADAQLSIGEVLLKICARHASFLEIEKA
jgi:hypothetical protein